ncbi:uncharacterized protein [Parasteatoda tepidariorum]|uniref:uncharacterized protein n=1 Tax=Parasteatoda tepidariorum TaxID=114398 RepID=UPI000A2C0BE8|nr:uncharacterized protein LOC107443364 [Parasteatoda tepidariorum]XP_021003783.1 uncharacterized protein LOC107443364 [Parasteatoda tepidariorum]
MRLRGYTYPSVAIFFLLLIVPLYGRRIHHNKSAKNELAKSEDFGDFYKYFKLKDIHNLLTDEENDEGEECQIAALHKCGQTFLRAHKILSYINDDVVAYRTICGVRTAFFDCLKTTKERICSKGYKHSYNTDPDFRKKLADALWSARVCVVGVPNKRLH